MDFNNERKSGISRIRSETPEQGEIISSRFEDALRTQEFGSVERAPTPEERDVIERLIPIASRFCDEYGGTPVANIGPANIHILDPERLSPEDSDAIDRLNVGGLYDRDRQAIFVLPAGSLLTTAQRITHELIHFHSFQSLQDEGPEQEPAPRRMGFSIFDARAKQRFFRDLDEAIVEELAKRLDGRYFGGIEALKGALDARDRLRKLTKTPDEIAATSARQLPDGRWQTEIDTWKYGKARERLRSLIRTIYERNRGRFTAEEEVFKVFAKAVFTGKLLDIARLIEHTFGPGSFSELGMETMITEAPAPDEPGSSRHD